MSLASDLLVAAVSVAEGNLKEGFDIGGVSFNYNQENDTITGSFVIPVTPVVDANGGVLTFTAKDAFEYTAPTP